MRKSNLTILIICEGKNTEPHFFNSIRDEIIIGNYQIGEVVITIRPEPIIDEIEKAPSTYKPKRAKRTLRKELTATDKAEIAGVPPLKWVLAGQEELRNGAYNEVWVVFDHDNHPARKEAFEKADEMIKGEKVRIAFSSRSFEYYLLLNFERLYYRFLKTECKTAGDNKKPIYCGTYIHPADCNGKICINGYALIQGYWDNSKDNISLFPLIKNKLQLGFENCIWLRFESNKHESGTPIYDRNPYVTVDELVKRLTGNSLILLENGATLHFKNITVTYKDKKIILENNSTQAEIIPKNSFLQVDHNGNRTKFGLRKLLIPGEKIDIELAKDQLYFIFSFDNTSLMFEL